MYRYLTILLFIGLAWGQDNFPYFPKIDLFGWVDLGMFRYIILLLITGIVWAQTEFDTLVLKDGTTYLGVYSKTEKEIVYFKPQNAFAFQPVPVQLIKRLKSKDGHYIIGISSESEKEQSRKGFYIMIQGCCVVITIFGLGFLYALKDLQPTMPDTGEFPTP
jgi:hypothetical protein